jgi:hypothetical protein
VGTLDFYACQIVTIYPTFLSGLWQRRPSTEWDAILSDGNEPNPSYQSISKDHRGRWTSTPLIVERNYWTNDVQGRLGGSQDFDHDLALMFLAHIMRLMKDVR